MKKSMLLTAAFIFIAVFRIYSFDDMNRRIGIIYLKNAAAYYLNEQYDEAERFLEKTSEFHDTSSDYEYLYGLIRLEKENRINDAADYFERAIDNGNWILLDKKDCVTDLSLILFRKKEYLKLINIVEQEAYPDYNDNDLMYLYLLSLKYAGRSNDFSVVLNRAVSRYSDDYRFALLFVHENINYRNRVLSGMQVFRNEEGQAAVMFEAAMTLEDSGEKLAAIKKYHSAGGKDVSSYIEYYRLRGNITDEELEGLLSKKIFENPANIKRLESILPRIEQRRRLEEAWQSYTGNVYYDFNDDGYFEELHLYENGIPVGVSIDENQDGIIEVMLIFDGENPAEVIISGETFSVISFEDYPYVKELSVSEGSEREVYTFLKAKLSLPVYEIRSADNKLVFNKDNVEQFLSDLEVLKNSAVRISSYTGGGAKDNYVYLKKELERRDELYSVLKIYNKIIGNYVYQQVNDKRTTGFADIDYDNLIDLKENYKDGRIISIEADDNKNGIFDFKITFDEDKSVSWWDFNEDGLYDCRQYSENGVIINEYSSNFDGNFDIIERN
ncbi:MAG: hypothetical protein PQJ61_09830 [Spirochaetales bacterium]|uniref:Tetratricopeptide repeat protein n=1 Tax=Candidatus Thalassospirochaeta sargassi TaxID=3119039 RepID=A0AAJ1IF94_9SPIO|nr:hypothetical protein [Spirochaetales bacterium]